MTVLLRFGDLILVLILIVSVYLIYAHNNVEEAVFILMKWVLKTNK